MDVRVGLWRKLSTKELMLLNYGVGEDSWESFGLQDIKPVSHKGNQSWMFIRRTDSETEAPMLWSPDAKNWLIGKGPDAGKDWRREEKGTDRGWDGWMASLTQWTWVWVNSGSWWWTGKPGVLQSMASQRVGHNWVTKLTDWLIHKYLYIYLTYRLYAIRLNEVGIIYYTFAFLEGLVSNMFTILLVQKYLWSITSY